MTTKCRLCSNNSKCIFTTKVLKKYDVKYYFCSKCQFLQTEEPYWLEEAYSSVICAADTGSVARNFIGIIHKIWRHSFRQRPKQCPLKTKQNT